MRQLFLPRRVRVHRFDVALQELLPVRAVQAQVASVRHLQDNHRLLSVRQLAIIDGQTSNLWCYRVKLPNLKLRSRPEQLLGSLPLDIVLAVLFQLLERRPTILILGAQIERSTTKSG